MAPLHADWPAPDWVRAFTTTRAGGVSSGPWATFNLGERCGDDPRAVAHNRALFRAALPSEPGWLRQVHGARVLRREDLGAEAVEADAVWSATPRLACTVLTADCLPVLFCDPEGRRVAAAHAGWRGLAAGVLQATVQAMGAEPGRLLAWLGPGISQAAYTVGEEFRNAFLALDPGQELGLAQAFVHNDGAWRADLYAIARGLLAGCGLHQVFGGEYCTYTDAARFFSYRRDGNCGRMATTIWMG